MMLTRRHIRIKVMQALYAFKQTQPDKIEVEEKFLQKSIDEMYDLFLLNLSLIIALKNKAESYLEITRRKRLATEADKNPNDKFVHNQLIAQLINNPHLQDAWEDRKINHWQKDDEYVGFIWKSVRTSDLYQEYTRTQTTTYKEDKDFLIALYKEVIAPHPKLYEYIEDKKLTWLDDFPVVNTSIIKCLQKAKPTQEYIPVPKLYKNLDDREFAIQLYRKTLLNQESFEPDIHRKTPNWDKDRIAEIDRILLNMAVCEFLKFPSIPVKVSINESIEIAKEYSTSKSSFFINGVLDKLSKDYQAEEKLNKVGRGLM